MLKKIGLKFRSFALFTIIFLVFNLFTACDSPFSTSINDYLDYWSNSVTIGRYDVISEITVLDGRRNLSAVEPIQINLIITNPNGYEIELEIDGEPNFKIFKSDDEAKDDITIRNSKKIELSSDGSLITIKAELPNDTERKNLMMEGKFKYYKQAETGEIREETVDYTYNFKQLSAPDNPKNLKNPEYSDADAYHSLHFDMPDSSLNRNKDLTYRIDCYSSTTPGEFSFVATADVKADQAKKSGTKSNEFIYYFDEQEPSLQYDYVVTAISPEGVKSKVVSTSDALGLCYVTEPEIIFGDNGELNNFKAEKAGETKAYDVIEYTGDSFGINVIKTDSTSELEVKVNGKTVSADATLEDGFNKITATASKNRARPVTVTKNIYVVKKLVEPKITTNASLNGTTASNGINYDVLQYSYLAYDNCTYSIDNSANADSQITFKLDNNTTTDLSGTLADGKHSLEIIVSKDYCNPITVKKNYSVGIKQINLCVGEIKMKHEGDDKEDVVELDGTIYAKTTRSSKLEKTFNSSGLKKEHYHTFSSNLILKEKTDMFYFWTTQMIDHDTWGAQDELGEIKEKDSEMTRSLKDLKSDRYFHKKQQGESSKYYSEYTFTVTLSEYALPLLTFTPDLSGVSNGGYECIEVADSNSKAKYSITSQETGTTIYGTIDDEEFTGEKTGELAVGKHKIKIISTKSGSTPYITYRYINVLTKFNEPNIYFYANNTNNRIDTSVSDSPVNSYTTYDLTLTTSGTGNATLEVVAGTGETVTVQDGKNTLTAKNGRYELALGPHNLSIIVSKTGYLPKIINKDIYIQGVLAEPTVIANNGSGETGSGNTEDDPKVWKFSYLSDPSLNVYIQPGNRGDNPNTVKVYLNSTDGTEFEKPTSGFSVGYDSVKHLVIVQTRPYCKTKTTHKYVKGIIKPIKLIYHNVRIAGGLKGDARICLGGIKGVDNFDLLGEIKFDGTTIWGYGSSEYPIDHSNYWDHLNTDTDARSYERTLYSPDDIITLEMINMRRRKKDDNFGSHTLKKTLSAIKNVTVPTVGTYNVYTLDPPGGSNGWIFFTGRLTNGNCYMYMYLKFEVEEQN